MEQSAISEPETRSESVKERSDPSIIDRSVRIPVLIFLASGVFWLVVASGFWLLASSQIHTPAAWWTFPGVAWLSFGRTYPAFLNCFVYGWATCAGIGVGIWLLARFSRVPLRNPLFPILAAATWNIGIAVGVEGLFEFLEFFGSRRSWRSSISSSGLVGISLEFVQFYL